MAEAKLVSLRRDVRLVRMVAGMRQGLNKRAIATQCGVHVKTIERDFNWWRDNGGFDEWLTTEFLLLHQQEVSKEGAGQAYRVVADLLRRRLKEQASIEVTGLPEIIIKVIDNVKATNTDGTASAQGSTDSPSK